MTFTQSPDLYLNINNFFADQSTSTSQSFTLVPNDKVSKLGAKLQKETRTIGPLNKIRNQELDIRLECEWEECIEVFDKLHAFLDHVAFHVTDVPIISTKITSEDTDKEGYHDLVDDGDGQKTFGCLWLVNNNHLNFPLCEKKRTLSFLIPSCKKWGITLESGIDVAP